MTNESLDAALATALTDAEPAAGPSPTDLWIERVGKRQYTGFNGRGARVEIGSPEHDHRFSPGELLKIALAGCTGLSGDVALARRLGDDFEATLHVSGAADREEERYPTLVERLEVDLSGLDPEARERLLTVVRRAIDVNCTVGRTLERGATIELTIADGAATAAPEAPATDLGTPEA